MFRNSKLLFWTCEILLLTVIFYIWKSMGTLISPFVSVLNTILLPFLIAGFLYYITNPIVELLEKHLKIDQSFVPECEYPVDDSAVESLLYGYPTKSLE